MTTDLLIDKDRVLALLGAGLSNEIVASTLGCDPSYISQLMAADEFREQVITRRTIALTANSERDRKVDGIEDALLNKLETHIEYLTKPGDILRAFQVVNAAKRRGVQQHESTIINNQIVNLTMPVQVVHNFVKNGMNEVVQIGDRPLITIGSNTLLKKVAVNHPDEQKRNELDKLARSLPSAIEEQLAVRDSPEDGRMPSRSDYAELGITREA